MKFIKTDPDDRLLTPAEIDDLNALKEILDVMDHGPPERPQRLINADSVTDFAGMLLDYIHEQGDHGDQDACLDALETLRGLYQKYPTVSTAVTLAHAVLRTSYFFLQTDNLTACDSSLEEIQALCDTYRDDNLATILALFLSSYMSQLSGQEHDDHLNSILNKLRQLYIQQPIELVASELASGLWLMTIEFDEQKFSTERSALSDELRSLYKASPGLGVAITMAFHLRDTIKRLLDEQAIAYIDSALDELRAIFNVYPDECIVNTLVSCLDDTKSFSEQNGLVERYDSLQQEIQRIRTAFPLEEVDAVSNFDGEKQAA